MTKNVNILAKGWLIQSPNDYVIPKEKILTHTFLLPGLDEGCQVVEIDHGDNYRILALSFFSGDNAISYIFIHCDDIEWEQARKLLYCKDKLIVSAKSESKTLARFMLCAGSPDECAKEGSHFVRNSSTLKHGDSLPLDRGVDLLLEPRGIVAYADTVNDLNLLISKEATDKMSQFERWGMLFSLGLANREVILKSIERMGEELAKIDNPNSDSTQVFVELGALRESIVMFDARYYFQAPIRPDRHELFKIAKKVVCVLDIKSLHEEMEHQVNELSKLADHKLEMMQKEHQDLMAKKAGAFNFWLGFLAIVLAIIELFSRSPLEWGHAFEAWKVTLASLF